MERGDEGWKGDGGYEDVFTGSIVVPVDSTAELS